MCMRIAEERFGAMNEIEFRIGDRVQLSDLGRLKAKRPDRSGVVVGVSRSGSQFRVQWDGLKLPYFVHWTFLEPEQRANRE